MYRMLDCAASQGIHAIIATSHITPGVRRFDMEGYRRALREAREYCEASGYDMTIYEGCEILYTRQTCRLLQEGEIPTLAGTDFVLVEFSPDIRFAKLREALQDLISAGYRPVVAHVERYRCLFRGKTLQQLRSDFDVRCQMNCQTVYRKNGFWQERRVNRWLTEGLIDCVSSDAHNMTTRPFGMRRAYRALSQRVGKAEARRLTGL